MSKRMLNAAVPCAWLLLTICGPSIAQADLRGPRKNLNSISFDAVLYRINVAQSTGEWKNPGWKDQVIERWVSKLVAEIARATNRGSLRIPVRFDEVDTDEQHDHPKKNKLQVVKDWRFPFVQKTIVLSCGSVSIAHADDSIIIARGSVDVSHGNRNIIICGKRLHVSHDGSDGRLEAREHGIRAHRASKDFPMKHGSLLMSGVSIDVSHARGSVCSAPEMVTIGNAHQVVYLNSRNRTVKTEHGRCFEVGSSRIPEITSPVELNLLR